MAVNECLHRFRLRGFADGIRPRHRNLEESEQGMNRSTVSEAMCSASTALAFSAELFSTAAFGSARTLGGSDPRSSVRDWILFHTGTFRAAFSVARIKAFQLRLRLVARNGRRQTNGDL